VPGVRLVLVGHGGEVHVGAHFLAAARQLRLPVEFLEAEPAYTRSRLVRAVMWRLGRRPARLGAFSREVVRRTAEFQATHVLTTGFAPVSGEALEELRRRGITSLNFLTDDPWNRAQYAPWFLKVLPRYDTVFSPRRMNLEDLRALGCRVVSHLPFAYHPELHFPAEGASAAERAVDVLFAGGADADRLPCVRALVKAGLNVALYGGYWDRHADLRPHADLATLRRITPAAKMVLCLVRRANRDGHAMRSFEAPAMGGCLLLEDTPEHRELFGADGEGVVFFRDTGEMVAKAKALLPRAEERARLAAAAHRRICSGGHTYADRLRTMLAEGIK
jgi:spore maturation protein CgeB